MSPTSQKVHTKTLMHNVDFRMKHKKKSNLATFKVKVLNPVILCQQGGILLFSGHLSLTFTAESRPIPQTSCLTEHGRVPRVILVSLVTRKLGHLAVRSARICLVGVHWRRDRVSATHCNNGRIWLRQTLHFHNGPQWVKRNMDHNNKRKNATFLTGHDNQVACLVIWIT